MKTETTAELLRRAAAAVETPGDLTADEKAHLVADLLAEAGRQPAPIPADRVQHPLHKWTVPEGLQADDTALRTCRVCGLTTGDPVEKAAGLCRLDHKVVVIDVCGGVVQAVFCAPGLDVILVDWDNIDLGDNAVRYPTYRFADMPDETRNEIDRLLRAE